MLKKVFIILMLGLITACQKYPDPFINLLENYSFGKYGSDQKANAGNYLKDSIGVQVSNSLNYSTDERIQVQFEVIKGGGEVDHSTVITNANGYAYTNWKLGNEPGEQTVRAKIFDPSDKILTDISFKAFGFQDNVWNTITLEPDIKINDMVVDTLRHLTFMTTLNTLYMQGDNYYEWEEISNININAPRTIEINSEGTLYVGNWQGDLSKSEDSGRTWINCNKPIPAGSSNFNMVVSSDKYIWATALGYPLHCSRDGGETWSIDSIGLGSNILLRDLFRLSDGTYFLHASNINLGNSDVFKSEDGGKSWTPVQVPGGCIKLHVTEKDEIIVCRLYDGFSIHKSIDHGQNFIQVYQTRPAYVTYMDHSFHKTKDFYYVLVPGEGILKTNDLDTFELYWYKLYLSKLFMDHNGVLIAKDQSHNEVYYRRNSE